MSRPPDQTTGGKSSKILPFRQWKYPPAERDCPLLPPELLEKHLASCSVETWCEVKESTFAGTKLKLLTTLRSWRKYTETPATKPSESSTSKTDE